MSDRSRSIDLALAAAGVAGLLAFALLYRQATPQAAVSLDVTRSQARTVATEFLATQDAELDAYRHASTFGASSIPFVFLQRSLGLEEASRWAREEVPVWTWRFRWFRPLEKEEWQVEVGVDGALTTLRHLVDEAAPGANMEVGAAERIASEFLVARGWDLSQWERVEASSEKRDNRTDHSFTWERRGSRIPWREEDPEAGSGSVRLSVDVVGDRVGSYRHYLRVPEEFSRDLQTTLSVGTALTFGSVAFIVVLGLVALGIAIARTRRDDVRWKPALILAGFTAILFLVQQATGWRVLQYSYPTSFSWPAFVGAAVVGVLLLSTLYAVFVLFPAAAGESLARETFPASLVGFLDAIRGRLRTQDLARASLRGYALGFFFLGYLTVFYVLARRFAGAWLPAEGPSSQIFDLYLPAVTPLAISLVAAISEEVTFRLFGISLFKRYFGSTAVALVLPAVIWAFAHSSYAVFPVYVRGIELTIGGILFGLAFLRLGLVACIVGHYVVDAVLFGMPLLTSGNGSYVLSGIVVSALALLPAVLALLDRRRSTEVTPP